MLRKMRRLLMRTSPIKMIPLVVAGFLLTSVINIYIYKVENDNLLQFNQHQTEQYEEESWNEVVSLIKMANVASRQNSKYIAKKIEVDILRQYDDLDLLKSEFSNGEFNNQFHKILMSNLVDENGAPSALYPPSYYTIVGMDKGVIAIFSNEAAATLTASGNESIINWDDYAHSRPNPKLAAMAIDSVMKRSSDLIFWQNAVDDDKKIQGLNSMTIEMLREVYDKKGLQGLSNYSIVSPSYITENGDVFETDDVTLLQKNKNYKLVILQSFNLLDVLEKYEVKLEISKHNSESNIAFIDQYIQYKFIKTILGSLILFILSLFFVNVYNSAFVRKKNEQL